MQDRQASSWSNKPSCTISFSLSGVFINPKQQIIFHASIPHWRIIFPFFLRLPPEAQSINPKQEGYIFGCTQNEIVAFSNGLSLAKIGQSNRQNAGKGGFAASFTPSSSSVSMDFLPDGIEIDLPKGRKMRILVVPPVGLNVRPDLYRHFIELENAFCALMKNQPPRNSPAYDPIRTFKTALSALKFEDLGSLESLRKSCSEASSNSVLSEVQQQISTIGTCLTALVAAQSDLSALQEIHTHILSSGGMKLVA